MSDHDKKRDEPPVPRKPDDKPANTAPDAVTDPSEKTDGKPGEVGSQGGETDPGGG